MFGTVKPLIKVYHPEVSTVSVQNSPAHYSSVGTSEIAFFNEAGEFVEVAQFAQYELTPGEGVYGWVPTELVEEFLSTYARPC